MGVLGKIADATRAKLEAMRDRKMARIDGKPLRELSDTELEAERERRRRARGLPSRARPEGHRGAAPAEADEDRGRPTPGWRLRQWYRALELEPGASLEAVEDAYQRLLAKYDPDKHKDDAEKHRAATRLAAGLGEAYYGLRDHLEG